MVRPLRCVQVDFSCSYRDPSRDEVAADTHTHTHTHTHSDTQVDMTKEMWGQNLPWLARSLARGLLRHHRLPTRRCPDVGRLARSRRIRRPASASAFVKSCKFHQAVSETLPSPGGITLNEFINGCERMKGQAKGIDVHLLLLECQHLHEKLDKLDAFTRGVPYQASAKRDCLA